MGYLNSIQLLFLLWNTIHFSSGRCWRKKDFQFFPVHRKMDEIDALFS